MVTRVSKRNGKKTAIRKSKRKEDSALSPPNVILPSALPPLADVPVFKSPSPNLWQERYASPGREEWCVWLTQILVTMQVHRKEKKSNDSTKATATASVHGG